MTAQRLVLGCKHCAKAGTSQLGTSLKSGLPCCALPNCWRATEGRGAADKNQGPLRTETHRPHLPHEQQINAPQPQQQNSLAACQLPQSHEGSAGQLQQEPPCCRTTMLHDSCHRAALGHGMATCCSH